MSESRAAARENASAAWARHEPILDRFEGAWQRGERPRIDDYLPPDDPDRRALLLELACADLECRLKAGEAACVEDYLGRYAELVEGAAAVLSLVRVERAGRADPITTEEFQRRFARYLGQPTVGVAGGAERTLPGAFAAR